MSTAHEPSFSEDGMPKDRYRLYHVEKAKGGIALTMTAGSAVVSPNSPPVFGNLLAYKDEIVPWMRRLSDDCHAHGAAVMIQLTHLGRRTAWNKADWLPVLAPSPVREPAHRAFPKAVEDWDVERIVADYAAAAQRMQAAGLDGIEIEAYGHLPDQFWSPATNHRSDEYGGSLDNRLRFTLRVLDAVRVATGAAFIVGIRMVADEDWDIGLPRAEGIEIARRLVASGKVDFLNVIRGHMDTDAALRRVIPIHGMPAAPHLDFAGEVRAATRFPVFHAARIQDVATARHAIAAGKLDMVGMTRAHIADPYIGRRLMEGREHEIRPCVGATYCLDRIYEGNDAVCVHNAATGREATMPHVIARSSGPRRKVVVVGAGPAGLEAARVSAARGHDVVVFEAAERPGGQVLLASRAPRRKELIGIIDWRVATPRGPWRHPARVDLCSSRRCAGRESRHRIRRHGRGAEHRRAGKRRRSRHVHVGCPVGCRNAGAARAGLRRQRRPSGDAGGRIAGGGGKRCGDRHARTLFRAGDRRASTMPPMPRCSIATVCGSRSMRG